MHNYIFIIRTCSKSRVSLILTRLFTNINTSFACFRMNFKSSLTHKKKLIVAQNNLSKTYNTCIFVFTKSEYKMIFGNNKFNTMEGYNTNLSKAYINFYL